MGRGFILLDWLVDLSPDGMNAFEMKDYCE